MMLWKEDPGSTNPKRGLIDDGLFVELVSNRNLHTLVRFFLRV
jgi:hypothetical protein